MSFFKDHNGKIDGIGVFLVFGLLPIPLCGLLGMIICGLAYFIPHFFSGPCAFRGGVDRMEADYVVCSSGDRRSYDPKTKTFYDVKILLTNGETQ